MDIENEYEGKTILVTGGKMDIYQFPSEALRRCS
jgi:hypothetical protein